jgi:hypothetical protein
MCVYLPGTACICLLFCLGFNFVWCISSCSFVGVPYGNYSTPVPELVKRFVKAEEELPVEICLKNTGLGFGIVIEVV